MQNKREEDREAKKSKLQILKTLMATRGANLCADHINALNLIDFEFYKVEEVRKAWKEYLAHLNPTETQNSTQWATKRLDLLTCLIVKIAAHLNYHYEHVDLKSNCYLPSRWTSAEEDLEIIRQGLRAWVEKKSALPLQVELINDSEAV